MNKVALVTGNDTGVGKTYVAAALARVLSSLGQVRYVKVVETGITDAADSDARRVELLAKDWMESTTVLRSYEKALAPVAAADLKGEILSLGELVGETRESLGDGWTIVEGAGGVAVPLELTGGDWRDFATNLPVDAVILVLENRLGAINQMRLLESYCQKLPMACGFWLNEVRPQREETIRTNEAALAFSKMPTWAIQRHDSEPECLDLPWARDILE